jgi:hypothetical protein
MECHAGNAVRVVELTRMTSASDPAASENRKAARLVASGGFFFAGLLL